MPMVSKTIHICDGCGAERTINQSDWKKVPEDDAIFKAPECPTCGAIEVFFYHDDVAIKRVVEERPFPPEVEGGPERKMLVHYFEPDPEAYDAIHMTIVEEIATDLGVKQRKLKPSERPDYAAKPKKPTSAKMREVVRARIESSKPKPPKTKEQLEVEYAAAVEEGKAQAKKRKEEKAASKAKKQALADAVKEKILPPGKMGKEDTEPRVDKPNKKTFPKSAQPKVKEED